MYVYLILVVPCIKTALRIGVILNIDNKIKSSLSLHEKEYCIETGSMATFADGSVTIQCGGTVVLVTVCVQKNNRPSAGFLPLSVEYMERMYAIGKIPGNFFRRETGKLSERETLVSRLIDRPIRPFFPKGFSDEIQVIATVLSSDQENNADVLAITGASTAIMLSSIPFEAPIVGARIAKIDGELILNPNNTLLAQSDMNIIFAASADALVMVEGEARFITEEEFMQAIDWGHQAIQPLLQLQKELQLQCGKEKLPFTSHQYDDTLFSIVKEYAIEKLTQCSYIPEKMNRKQAKQRAKQEIIQNIYTTYPHLLEDETKEFEIEQYIELLEKEIIRKGIQKNGIRIDGRNTTTVRPIHIETSVLPRTHGSALFTRGETQSLVITTLGSRSDEQKTDLLLGDSSKNFMLHYNFAPFSVGEVKPLRVSRREIGHGALAERAIAPILPDTSVFPYTIRIVAETLKSNGSSSMAAVCGGVLSLMDAGVPITTPVAGVAMGLIKEGDEYIVLTDILGDEDALGDMDFKIAGNTEGITAIQMDIKIKGIPTHIMAQAMAQAKQARVHILEQMLHALPTYRETLSRYAPQHSIIHVAPDTIASIIGPSGKNIKQIIAQTDAIIDIEDDGTISIFAHTKEALEKASARILAYSEKAEIGKNYHATVKRILDIGAIVELTPTLEAFVHISQLSTHRIEQVSDMLHVGQPLDVKVIEIKHDKIRASHKAILFEQQGIPWNDEQLKKSPHKKK